MFALHDWDIWRTKGLFRTYLKELFEFPSDFCEKPRMSNKRSKRIAALDGIETPDHLIIDVASDYNGMLREIGKRSVGFSGVTLFGCAFIQGNRLQFTTAMPITKMLEISNQDRARKGANVAEVLDHSNRPREAPHEKKIRDYLLDTACEGEKFILPSFTFNFGVRVKEETPDATLVLLDEGHDGSITWPAILVLPHGAFLDTTDGAHRRNTIYSLYMDKKLDDDLRLALLNNSVDVKLVFESSRRDSHQDFADCGRAKSIAKSLLTAYDARDFTNRLASLLGNTHPFLAEYVDASANNVNLSGQSHKIWSLYALNSMVSHIIDMWPDPRLSNATTPLAELDQVAAELVKSLSNFFDCLVKALPQFRVLEDYRLLHDMNRKSETPALRERLGGDVAMRAIGLFIFARAFLHCVHNNLAFSDMAEKLTSIDWHVLGVERDMIPPSDDPDEYQASVLKHANPLWRPLLVIKPKRFKISSSRADGNTCWDKVALQVGLT